MHACMSSHNVLEKTWMSTHFVANALEYLRLCHTRPCVPIQFPTWQIGVIKITSTMRLPLCTKCSSIPAIDVNFAHTTLALVTLTICRRCLHMGTMHALHLICIRTFSTISHQSHPSQSQHATDHNEQMYQCVLIFTDNDIRRWSGWQFQWLNCYFCFCMQDEA